MRTKLFTLSLLVLLLASLVAPALVQATPTAVLTSLTEVGQAGGVTNAVVLSGGQLYFNVGPRIARKIQKAKQEEEDRASAARRPTSVRVDGGDGDNHDGGERGTRPDNEPDRAGLAGNAGSGKP